MIATVLTADESKKKPKPLTQKQMLAELMPLPENVPRVIMNPYHAKPVWKNWSKNASPVSIDKPHFKGVFKPLPLNKRTYPVFIETTNGGEKLSYLPLKKGVAGYWDDCYMSLDVHHTRLSKPNGFIDGGKMRTAQDVRTMMQLGTNFTSQSYSSRGRAIVDDLINNLFLERFFFFANCIRATPSHISYEDKKEHMASDVYDGLFGHAYQSVGQSGSEMHGIFKMMLAGAAMPRKIKDLLKHHGAYAPALLTLFKAALPYVDADGKAVPYENELRHRVAYSSHGTPQHVHFCSANAHYHGYNDKLHLKTMMDMASKMKGAPPVAIAKLSSFKVKDKDGMITDQASLLKRVKSINLTTMRFWGMPGDTLYASIDLSKSYDLQKKKLTFSCLPVYPNQKNISIQEESPGKYLIQVKHDPKLPKGRLPVICTVRNGLGIPSNPVFINFYWPGKKEVADYFPTEGIPKNVLEKVRKLGLRRLPVNVNKRPSIDFGFPGDAIRCKAGEKISIKLIAKDPEGFPITTYLRPGEIGALKNGVYTVKIPPEDKEKIYRIHFIFSDGTGAFTGSELKLIVSHRKDRLPKGWITTVFGQPMGVGSVSVKGTTFTFEQQPYGQMNKQLKGLFVYKEISGKVDIICRLPDPLAAELSLVLSNTPDSYSSRIRVGIFEGKVSGTIKRGTKRRARRFSFVDKELMPNPKYVRLVYTNRFATVYVSTDRKAWQLVHGLWISLFKNKLLGLVYGGSKDKKPVSADLLESPKTSLPRMYTDRRPDQKGNYRPPLMITVDYPEKISYTVSSIPNRKTLNYSKPIKLTEPGRHEIRAWVSSKGKDVASVVAIYNIAKPPSKKSPPKKHPGVKK
ncbi:MAG: hypothetical protein MJH11_17440 [Lentisphaeria bacterium]|nr:hypothetical protein [Lentisphaeria bacterium]